MHQLPGAKPVDAAAGIGLTRLGNSPGVRLYLKP